MAGGKAPGRRGPDSGQREALAARAQAAADWQRSADERDVLARERERRAGERETRADEREREADKRERDLDEQARRLGAAIQGLERRTLQTIARSRALLEASGQRLNRQEAAVKRSGAERERQQADVDRASAEANRGLAAWLPDPAQQIERSAVLRKQAMNAIEAFAANEEEVARIHEELAARNARHRDEYQRTAARARQTARRARALLHTLRQNGRKRTTHDGGPAD